MPKYKYWFSEAQSEGGYFNYVCVNGEWEPYSEITSKEGEVSNWDDARLVAESDVELPIRYGEMTLLEMQERKTELGF